MKTPGYTPENGDGAEATAKRASCLKPPPMLCMSWGLSGLFSALFLLLGAVIGASLMVLHIRKNHFTRVLTHDQFGAELYEHVVGEYPLTPQQQRAMKESIDRHILAIKSERRQYMVRIGQIVRDWREDDIAILGRETTIDWDRKNRRYFAGCVVAPIVIDAEALMLSPLPNASYPLDPPPLVPPQP